MFRVANAAYYLRDRRSHRQLHDIKRPAIKGLSMLGTKQRNWLLEQMQANQDTDFQFVVPPVNFMVPLDLTFDVATKNDA